MTGDPRHDENSPGSQVGAVASMILLILVVVGVIVNFIYGAQWRSEDVRAQAVRDCIGFRADQKYLGEDLEDLDDCVNRQVASIIESTRD